MEHDLYQDPEAESAGDVPEVAAQPRAEASARPARPPAIATTYSALDVTSDERTMAALAHGSIILTLLTGGLGGLIVAFVVWAVYRDKSRWVANQSLQAVVFQGAATLAAYVLGLLAATAITISSGLMAILIGLCLFPFALLLGLVAVVFPFAATAYGIFGALEVYQGRDFQYRWVGKLVAEKQGG